MRVLSITGRRWPHPDGRPYRRFRRRRGSGRDRTDRGQCRADQTDGDQRRDGIEHDAACRRHRSGAGEKYPTLFPKAERQTYVDAVAQANVSPAALAALRVQITGAAAAMAQLVWNNADPFALRVDETLNAMGGGPAAAIAGIRVRHSTGQATTQAERNSIKTAVLGVNGGLLAAWIGQAALAYTDSPTGVATDHYDGGGNGNVIRSTAGFTPVAGGGQGAVYEMREREIDMAEGDTAAIVNALTLLFNAA